MHLCSAPSTLTSAYQQLGHVHCALCMQSASTGCPKKGTNRMLLAGTPCAWIFFCRFLLRLALPSNFDGKIGPTTLVRIFCLLINFIFGHPVYQPCFHVHYINPEHCFSLAFVSQNIAKTRGMHFCGKRRKLLWSPYRISKGGHDDLFHEA